MEIKEALLNKKESYEQISLLQDIIANLSDESFNDVLKKALAIIKSRALLYSFLISINSMMISRVSSFDLYLKFAKELILKLDYSFDIYEYNQIFPSFYALLFLYDEGFITSDMLKILMVVNKRCKSFSIFFMPEILYMPSSTTKPNLSEQDVKNKRSQRRNDFKIGQVIFENDIFSFQNCISQSNINLDSIVPESSFEFPRKLTKKGVSLIEYSAFYGAIDIFKYLLMNGAKITENVFNFAVIGGNFDILHLVEKKIERLMIHQKALLKAIKYQRNEIANYLIDNYSDRNMILDINTAVKSVKYFNIEFLMKSLAVLDDVNLKGSNEKTLLFQAAETGQVELLDFFSKFKGIKINMHAKNGNSNPLFVSVQKCFIEVVRKLVEQPQISLNCYINYYDSILSEAVKKKNIELVKLLISQPIIDVNAVYEYGAPIHYAAMIGNIELFKVIAENGQHKVDYYVQDPQEGKTVVHYAAMYGHLEIIDYLVKNHKREVRFNSNDIYGVFNNIYCYYI